MQIELLSQDDYDTLLRIQQEFPKLTFQNVGYQYIDRSVFTEEEKQADAQVKEILNKHIIYFVSFDNFRIGTDRISRKKQLCVRFQYHYDQNFTGVGYITLRELHEGFDEEPSKKSIE